MRANKGGAGAQPPRENISPSPSMWCIMQANKAGVRINAFERGDTCTMAIATPYTIRRSQEMFERIKNSIAGGESSYARLRSGIELCVDHTAGARMWDVDGNEYIDYCLGYGPLI